MTLEMHPRVRLVAEFISLASDSITVVLGLIALIGLITQRRKLSLIVRLYLNNHFNQRAKKIYGNIEKLKVLDYNDKTQKADIVRLLHALLGQVRPWVVQRPSLGPVVARLESVSQKSLKITDGIKTEIAHELEEVMENLFLGDMADADNSGAGK